MELATFVVTGILALFFAGVTVGYKLRDVIGKEVKKFADELRAEYTKAKPAVEVLQGVVTKI